MHAPNLSLSEVSTEKLERELERGRDLARERERESQREEAAASPAHKQRLAFGWPAPHPPTQW